jgi:hypothetical protein
VCAEWTGCESGNKASSGEKISFAKTLEPQGSGLHQMGLKAILSYDMH